MALADICKSSSIPHSFSKFTLKRQNEENIFEESMNDAMCIPQSSEVSGWKMYL